MASPKTLRRAVSPEDKERRRSQILAAAKQRFADHGYHETTMADVARRAGLSYGVVYWYFESKDELFQGLMTAEEDALRAHIAAAIGEPDDDRDDIRHVEQVLRRAVRGTFEYFEQNPSSTRLLFRDTSALGDRFERQLSDIFGRFTAGLEVLVVRAQEQGALRAAPPRMVAYSCAALIAQIALRRQRTDDGLSVDEAAAFTVDLLIDGLAPRRDGDGDQR
jgi:AcrR family transcriptional regulator